LALIYISVAWLLGILLGASFSLPLALVLLSLLPLPLLVSKSHRRSVIILSLSLALFFGGAWFYPQSLPGDNDEYLNYYNDTGEVTVQGILSRDVEVGDKTNHLYLEVSQLKTAGGDWREVEGIALLLVVPYAEFKYGDELQVTGELNTPASSEGFDYRGYLFSQGIYSTMLYPEIEVLSSGNGAGFMEWIYSLREDMAESLSGSLPEPQASLAQGIILGIRGNIPDSVNTNFRLSGTGHLLAISGLHLSIIAGMILSLGIWLFGRRRFIYVWLALTGVWLFALVSGMHPPVVRAAIMASVFLLAELTGRQRNAITALMLAAAVMVAFEPYILWSVSFQMSFMAMAGLSLVFSPLRDKGRQIITGGLGESSRITPPAIFLSDALCVTLAALSGVLPLIAYYFGMVSLVGPLATLLALPVLPFIIITGALTGLLGIVSPVLAQVAGWLAWPFISYLLLLVGGMASLPIATISVPRFSGWLVVAYYLVLAMTFWLYRRYRRRRLLEEKPPARAGAGLPITRPLMKWLLPVILVIAIITPITLTYMPDDGRLHISFLDVGQGDAVFIQTPKHQDILIDGGPDSGELLTELGKRMPFWDNTIDLVILSHPQADHLTGLIEVLERYEVKQVLHPETELDTLLYQRWLELIEEKGIKATIARSGQQILLKGGITIDVLNPPEQLLQDTESHINNNSTVLRLTMGDYSFLLTGDIQREAEIDLISRRGAPVSTVLKVAHHGSASSSNDFFLDIADPQIAVISVGQYNRFGHPAEEVISRLEELIGIENIYRTDEDGTIEFVTDGNHLWVRTDR